jgi:S-DNA-T family DNA segregation ATPase FtsK/SpoIIIE
LAEKKTAKKLTDKKAAKKAYIQDTVAGLILVLAAVIVSVSLVSDLFGPLGSVLRAGFLGLFGAGAILCPVLFVYSAVMLFLKDNRVISKSVFSFAFILSFSTFFNIVAYTAKEQGEEAFRDYFAAYTAELWEKGNSLASGGVIGGWLSAPFEALCSKIGAGIIVAVIMIALLIIATGINPLSLFTRHGEYPEKKPVAKPDKALSKDIKGMKKDISDLKKNIASEPIPTSKEKRKQPELLLEKDSAPNRTDDVDSILNEITRSYSSKGKKSAKKKQSVKSNNTASLSEKDIDDLLLNFGSNPKPVRQRPEKPIPQPEKPPVVPAVTEQPVEEPPKPEPKKEEPPKTETIEEPQKNTDVSEALAGATVEISSQKTPEKLLETESDGYEFPSLDLLSFVPDNNAALYRDELKQNAARLIETLSDFKIDAKVLDAKRGPTVTRYELQPGTGVKTSKIANLSDDIALHLAAPAVRIEAPIPGKSAIGIEIPNKTTSIVYLKEIIGSEEFAASKSKIAVALGKSISGQPVVIDLAKMPHLLIAGVTGSGKSVCINSILISLLYKATPDEVKLILVDPKVVELNVYNGIPHLLIPVVTDPNKAAGALSWAVGEMLQRYKLFADKGVRDFNGYNKTLPPGEKKLPQVVIVIDELADLMMAAKGDVEDSICRLAQMARAAGMHLVIATQRPSADVITGLIKANIPSRIAFAVSSQINSHIILDASGAEKLIGKGDMLYAPLGEVKPIRVQGCFVSDQGVEKAVKAVKHGRENVYDDNIIKQIEQNAAMQKSGAKAGADDDDEIDDPKLDEAIQCVVEKGQASTTMLQKFVGLGYVRASKLIDVMEARGIVGPYQGSTPREVLITKSQWLEMKARKQQ